MHTVTESIYSGSNVIVALADVQHIEKWDKNPIPGIMVVTSHTKWNFDRDLWENAIWISEPEATQFRRVWCNYRAELEADTLMDPSPSKDDLMHEFDKTIERMAQAICGDDNPANILSIHRTRARAAFEAVRERT